MKALGGLVGNGGLGEVTNLRRMDKHRNAWHPGGDERSMSGISFIAGTWNRTGL